MKPSPILLVLVISVLFVSTVSAVDPWATFVPSSVSGTAPYNVTFVSISYNSPTSWNWTFRNTVGNNTEIEFSNSSNVTYAFSYGGTYLIRLNSSNSDGFNITPDLVYVTVSGPAYVIPIIPLPGTTTLTCTSPIVAALNTIGIMLVVVGLAGIFYSLLTIGGFGGGRSNYGGGSDPNMMLIVASVLSIMIGSVMLIMAYLIVSAVLGMSLGCT